MAGNSQTGKCAETIKVGAFARVRKSLACESGLLGSAFSPMQAVTDRLKNFLQYVAVHLIDEPSQAQLKVVELGPRQLRFKLVLAKNDVPMLIGRNGFTASAIRGMLKMIADKEGVKVTLHIHSCEAEAESMAREADRGFF